MFLRITRTQVDSARYQEAMNLSEEIIAAARQLPGLQGIYVAGDASAGRGVIATLWDTREHAQIDRAGPVLGEVVGRAQALGVQMEDPEIYEVSAHG